MENNFEGGVPPQEYKKGYSEEFVAKVKAEFPNLTYLHEHLDAGDDFVGNYLDDSRSCSVKPGDIVKALEGGEQEKVLVLEAAKKADRREKLYAEWLDSRRK